MNRIQTVLILGILTALFSCSTEPKSVDEGIYFQDFDNLRSWATEFNYSSEFAHSGLYSSATDSIHRYTLTFVKHCNEARMAGYTKMEASAWIFKPRNNIQAGFMASVAGENKELVYKSVDLNDIPHENAWTKVSLKIDLPVKDPSAGYIKVYAWAPKGDTIYMDDVLIRFYR